MHFWTASVRLKNSWRSGAWEAPVRERIVYASDAKEAAAPKPKPELPQALNEDVKAVAKDFRMIINEASPMLSTYLKKARLSAGEGNRLLIVLPDELSASAVCDAGSQRRDPVVDRAEDRQKSRDRRPPDGGRTQIRRSLCGSGESDQYGNYCRRRIGGYYHGKKRWIPRRRNAGKYGKSDETGTEDAASDGRTGKGNGDKRIHVQLQAAVLLK